MAFCPTCGGGGKLHGFARTVDANRVASCTAGLFDCPLCKGTGQVSEQRLVRIEQGKKMRQERVAAGQTLYDAAHEKGMSPSELSELENGGGFPTGVNDGNET